MINKELQNKRNVRSMDNLYIFAFSQIQACLGNRIMIEKIYSKKTKEAPVTSQFTWS